MRTIQISDESADKLFQDMLSSDYISLVRDIKSMERRINNGEKAEAYELEDYVNWGKAVYAINILFDWYLTPDDAKQVRFQATQ